MPLLCPPGPSPSLQGVVLNGDESARYWGNVNLSFAYVEGESLLMGLKVTLLLSSLLFPLPLFAVGG